MSVSGDYQHKALHEGPAAQRAWHRTKLELLDWFFDVVPGQKVLDIGCGSGVFSNAMAERGYDVLGLDANLESIRYAQETFGRDTLEFVPSLLDDMHFEENTFDGATCLEVIEHVTPKEVEAMLSTLAKVLKPGGWLVISTPNYRGLWPAIEWTVDRFSSAAKMAGEQHINKYHRRSFAKALEDTGYRVDKMRTFSTFAPFLAAVWGKLGRAAESVERKVDLPFGSILVARATLL